MRKRLTGIASTPNKATQHGIPRLSLGWLALLLYSLSTAQAAATTDDPVALQARITRVEQGLSPRVVVKGAPRPAMTLQARMAYHHVPAVSIALIDHGQVQWARAYGVADANSGQAATPATLFQAASISKTVAAVAALRMVEQGQLALDRPANDDLTHWKIPDNAFTAQQPVTLRMLLNHSAGINVHGFDGYAQGQPLPSLLQELDGRPPSNVEPMRVDTVPGTVWRYSGGGYSVVEQLMADVGGQPYAALAQRLVLDPLGMSGSTFATTLPPGALARAATAHDSNGQALPGRWNVYPESAAAGLWATPTDLAQLVLAVQRADAGAPDAVLSPATARLLLTRGLGEYSLGLFVEPLGDRTSFGHSGGNHGFRSQLYGYTRSGQGIVVMTNSDNGAALIEELLTSVATEYDWPEYRVVEKTALPHDARSNAALAGAYTLAGKPAHVIADGADLYFQSELFGSARMALYRASPDHYFMTAQDMGLLVQRDARGQVNGFSLQRNGATYPATRNR